MTPLLLLILVSASGVAASDDAAQTAEWKVGVASAKITPERRLHMAGYAGRKEPAEGTEQDLFGKAIAIEDHAGNRVVFVTLDLIGVLEKLRVAMNRRTPSEKGFLNHPNPQGPVDHTVPVLSVRNPGDNTLRAVVIGYACHNTTMGFLQWLGDYAGYAQEYIEADHPGVTALFMMGCGGDQNPYPRSELKYAQLHGRALATAVEAALEVNQSTPRHQRSIHGSLSSVLGTVDLEFVTPDRPDFAYPVQVVRFGNDLMLIALGTEVVIDYALRLKSELTNPDGPAIWVAGYSNVYSGYIPSQRVLLEGGYEASSRPWKPTLEERIVGKVHELVKQ
ncbi:MAG: hypothetical protein HYV60_16855 [Planctomycetia bacterium]|nr:hypothetical protein [Planctomycetia bacterium]